jgi:hypothetical protein
MTREKGEPNGSPFSLVMLCSPLTRQLTGFPGQGTAQTFMISSSLCFESSVSRATN